MAGRSPSILQDIFATSLTILVYVRAMPVPKTVRPCLKIFVQGIPMATRFIPACQEDAHARSDPEPVVSAVSAMNLWRWSHRFSQRLYHVLSLQAPGNPGVFCCPAYMCWQNESALVLSAMIWVLVALLNGLQYRAAPRHFPFSRARKTKSRSPTQRFIILTPQVRLTSA